MCDRTACGEQGVDLHFRSMALSGHPGRSDPCPISGAGRGQNEPSRQLLPDTVETIGDEVVERSSHLPCLSRLGLLDVDAPGAQ
jgi:hypothetical protein